MVLLFLCPRFLARLTPFLAGFIGYGTVSLMPTYLARLAKFLARNFRNWWPSKICLPVLFASLICWAQPDMRLTQFLSSFGRCYPSERISFPRRVLLAFHAITYPLPYFLTRMVTGSSIASICKIGYRPAKVFPLSYPICLSMLGVAAGNSLDRCNGGFKIDTQKLAYPITDIPLVPSSRSADVKYQTLPQIVGTSNISDISGLWVGQGVYMAHQCNYIIVGG